MNFPLSVKTCRLRVAIRGAVQGVGFRPFVYRLASELQLSGWVSNTAQGVFIEVEGEQKILDRFLRRLATDIPPRAFIQSLEHSFLDPLGYAGFEIRESHDRGAKTVLVLPDIATCPDCLNDIFDPSNRRYRYPFTNCTNCGPRFSIIERLPYDRPNTSMKRFVMCPECEQEYRDPANRRFHAQPNACPVCGPSVRMWNRGKGESGNAGVWMTRGGAVGHEAIEEAADLIRRGQIVAVKGLGGFQFLADARNDEAVQRLRERKRREEKPFAVMVPDCESAKDWCDLSEAEEHLLRSPEAPIVIMNRSSRESARLGHQEDEVASSVSPQNPTIGIMLPYTPLHHLLMAELRFPIVATSGNLADEPICTDEHQALERLGEIADAFLVHDRPIVRHVDDSVVRIAAGRGMILRRARGYAPLPVRLPGAPDSHSVIAVGAHLKNTVALVTGENAFISQHIGDLETAESLDAFQRVITDFQTLYDAPVQAVVCDLHPEYLSTTHARSLAASPLKVQHHHAHILSCMAENDLEGEVLGVAWDGTGFGRDGTVWGGEFLRVAGLRADRVAHLRTFRLPGGDAAVKQPRRSGLAILVEVFGAAISERSGLATIRAFGDEERRILLRMIGRGVNSPWTSSVGRLFDGVASIVGLRQVVRHEGQAAMELEWKAGSGETKKGEDAGYRIELRRQEHGAESPMILDWKPMIEQIVSDVLAGRTVADIARDFHLALVETIVAVAKEVKLERVVLSGGCFQNIFLVEQVVVCLRKEGFRPYWHQRVPPNDGGIALGQAYGAILGARRDA